MCVNDKAGAAAAMDTASASQEDSEEPGSSTTSGSFLYPEMTDPFVHHLELATTYDKIKTAILTVALMPARVFVICFLLVTAYFVACFGLLGTTEEDLREKPLDGWRRRLQPVICWLGRTTFRAGGMELHVKGRQASRQEAPVLVAAPHSTFLDSSITYVTGYPSIIVRRESAQDRWIRKLINYTQPVYVWRDDPDSRQRTIREIVARATSPLDWPQVLIFPEGTCTNRKALITFKQGAFYPAVPVQPVCIRYPNKLDTVTWTWEGPGALKLLWLTLAQPRSSCEIEFLPVYYPSPEERADPKLYAHNVREVMARALAIPTSDYTYADCRVLRLAKQLHLPAGAAPLVEINRVRIRHGLPHGPVEKALVAQARGPEPWISPMKLEPLAVPADLLALLASDSMGRLDTRDFRLAVELVERAKTKTDVLAIAFQVYGNGQTVHQETFQTALLRTLGIPPSRSQKLFQMIDIQGRGWLFADALQTRPELEALLHPETRHPKTD